NAHSEARARKWLAPNDLARKPQFPAHAPDLVLEKLPQRLEELQLHAGGEPAHVVVGLDEGGRIVADRDAFDDIRVKRALGQEAGMADRAERFLEHLDERAADDLAFFLGVADAPKAG